MDFIDELKQFSKIVATRKASIQTEEATKTSVIMPFFSLLGYDVFDPNEFSPEYIADVGIKKGEKVDYAILKDGKPIILIEAKSINEKLQKHDSQLFRYFATSKAKFAILTNGQIYQFFTDLEATNKMDEKPFLEIDLLDIKEPLVAELRKFSKANFDVDTIFSTASELKYMNAFRILFSQEMQNPSDDFVRFFLKDTYSGQKTQSTIDKFKPVLKKSLNQHVTDLMNEKIKNAFETADKQTMDESAEVGNVSEKDNKTVTTVQELEAYFVIKSLLKDIVPLEDITYRDNESYLNILHKNNRNKWICRLIVNEDQIQLLIPDANKNANKYILKSVYDIEIYKEELTKVINRYI